MQFLSFQNATPLQHVHSLRSRRFSSMLGSSLDAHSMARESRFSTVLQPLAQTFHRQTSQKPGLLFGCQQGHRFFINMAGYGQNKAYMSAMEKAVSQGVAILQGKVSASVIEKLVQQREQMVRDIDIFQQPMFQAEKAYRQNSFSFKGKPVSAKDLCDYVLSIAIRKEMGQRTQGKAFWLETPYFSNPFGVPRMVDNHWVTNETAGHKKQYAPYLNRAKLQEEDLRRAHDSGQLLQRFDQDHWEAPSSESLPQYWEAINTAFNELVSLKDQPKTLTTLDEMVNKTATVHWWMSQAMPYRRGTALIADMLTKVALDYLEIETPHWRGPGSSRSGNPNGELESFIQDHGVAPDLEAYITPLRDYVKQYPYFFERPLQYRSTGLQLNFVSRDSDSQTTHASALSKVFNA